MIFPILMCLNSNYLIHIEQLVLGSSPNRSNLQNRIEICSGWPISVFSPIFPLMESNQELLIRIRFVGYSMDNHHHTSPFAPFQNFIFKQNFTKKNINK